MHDYEFNYIYITYDIMIFQVVGHKFVRLFAPSESALLSPHPPGSKMTNNSMLDVPRDSVSLAAYFTDVLLYPGDVLFIPRWYWHYVASIDESQIESISREISPAAGCNDFESSPGSCKRVKLDDRHAGASSEIISPSFVFSVSFWWGARILKE